MYHRFLAKVTIFRDFVRYFAPSALLIFFSFLYSPLSTLIGVLGNLFSRKFEFEADAFATETTSDGGSMISALKRLTVENLGNLTPHPALVFLEYSHPPVLQRIAAIRALAPAAAPDGMD